MSELMRFYYNFNQFSCILEIESVANKLYYAITENEPIKESVRIKSVQPELLSMREYLAQFSYSTFIDCEKKFSRIKQYLQKNKFKMSKERKIEIFESWFYWTSIINKNGWVLFDKYLNEEGKSIDISCFSLEHVHEFAKEILYELNSLSICYNYKIDFGEYKNQKASTYYQQNILVRAICSGSVDNVKLLINNGLNLDNFKKYPFRDLKSILHYAYYWNNLEMIELLIQNGLTIDEDVSVINIKNIRDLKFSLLNYLKEKNCVLLKSLEFIGNFQHNHSDISYRNKSEKDKVLTALKNLKFRNGYQEEITQNKLINLMSETFDIIKSIHLPHILVKNIDFIRIFSNLFSKINKKYLIKYVSILKVNISFFLFEFLNYFKACKYTKYFQVNYYNIKNLYNTKYFIIIEYLLNYKLLSLIEFNYFFKYLNDNCYIIFYLKL